MIKLSFSDQPHIQYEQCATCGGAFLNAGESTDFATLLFTDRMTYFLRPVRRSAN